LIDLPVGEYGKIKDLVTAKRIKKHFEYIGKHLGMAISVEITDADAPI
jgi:thymidine phosphorylase